MLAQHLLLLILGQLRLSARLHAQQCALELLFRVGIFGLADCGFEVRDLGVPVCLKEGVVFLRLEFVDRSTQGLEARVSGLDFGNMDDFAAPGDGLFGGELGGGVF